MTNEKKQEPKYKAEEFNIAASDDRGHNAKIVFNVQPFIAKQAQQFVESRRFPYADKSALYRHGTYRHLKFLASLEGNVKTVMGQINVINKLFDDEEQSAAFQSTFQRLSSLISHYVGANEKIQAVRLITDVKQYLNEMPEGFWKRKYLEELDAKHGGFIKDVVKESKKSADIDLLEGEEDD